MNHLGYLLILASVGSAMSYQGGGILQTLMNPKLFMSLLGNDQPKPANCPDCPEEFCAMMFDELKCTNWFFPVPTGRITDIPDDLRIGTKAVVVKKGCKFVGTMPKEYT